MTRNRRRRQARASLTPAAQLEAALKALDAAASAVVLVGGAPAALANIGRAGLLVLGVIEKLRAR